MGRPFRKRKGFFFGFFAWGFCTWIFGFSSLCSWFLDTDLTDASQHRFSQIFFFAWGFWRRIYQMLCNTDFHGFFFALLRVFGHGFNGCFATQIFTDFFALLGVFGHGFNGCFAMRIFWDFFCFAWGFFLVFLVLDGCGFFLGLFLYFLFCFFKKCVFRR